MHDTEQLFAGSGILADNALFGPSPPSRTQSDDFISAHVALENDGTNDVLTAKISGRQALGPGSTGTGPADTTLVATVNVTGTLESDSVPPGTNLQLPVQIDHDGGIGSVPDATGFQAGSSVSIFWDGQATVFTNGHATQTSVFIGSLDVDETSLAINAGGSPAPTTASPTPTATASSESTPTAHRSSTLSRSRRARSSP